MKGVNFCDAILAIAFGAVKIWQYGRGGGHYLRKERFKGGDKKG